MLESILGYKSSWRILSLLLETPRKLVSRKELFEYTKLGNAPLSQGLNRLVSAGLIIKVKKGKKESYYINIDNDYSKLIKELWAKEKIKLRNLDYEIKIIISEFLRSTIESSGINQAILFGSWAKGTASANSDIDLALIFKGDVRELEVAKITKSLEHKFGKEIQTHCFTEKGFEKKNALINEIKKDGIVLL